MGGSSELQTNGTNGEKRTMTNLEQIAANYLPDLRTIQDSAPEAIADALLEVIPWDGDEYTSDDVRQAIIDRVAAARRVDPVRLFAIEFEGGSVDDLGPISPIWVDSDRGADRWAVLLPQGELGQAIRDIEHNTGAQLVSVRLWDGEVFGDGHGTIRSPKPGTLVASNLYGGGPDLPAGWTLENA